MPVGSSHAAPANCRNDHPKPFIGKVASSLEFLQAVYRDPMQLQSARMKAAIAAAPFEHARLSLNAQVNGLGDRIDAELAERLERNGVNTDDDPAT